MRLIFLLLPLFAFAAEPLRLAPETLLADPANDPAWRDLFTKLAPTKTRQSKFEERRFFPFRKEPVVLTGEVRIVPDVHPRYLPQSMVVSELDGMPVLSYRENPHHGLGGFPEVPAALEEERGDEGDVGHEEDAVEHPDDAHREGQVREIFEGHGDAEQDEKGHPFEEGDLPKTLEEGVGHAHSVAEPGD